MSNDARALKSLFADTSLGAPDNAIGYVLWRLAHRFQREADRVLAPIELTHLQFTTLAQTAWLGRLGNEVPQAEIARFGDMHPMQVSLMLKALEGKGLVTRERDTSHVRAKKVVLTVSGISALRRALPIMIDLQDRMFGDEGRPGGRLLRAVLALDTLSAEANPSSEAPLKPQSA